MAQLKPDDFLERTAAVFETLVTELERICLNSDLGRELVVTDLGKQGKTEVRLFSEDEEICQNWLDRLLGWILPSTELHL